MRADAWFIYAGDGTPNAGPAKLVRETFTLPAMRETDVLVEPVYGCWEGNMTHAIQRRPIDVCIERREPRVVLGNSGVVRVLEVGKDVKGVRPGQHAIVFGVGEEDRFGYMVKALGYDAPNTMGCLSTKAVLRERSLIPVPENTRFSLAQWAAFSLRYVTAWSNWQVALGTFRLQISADELAAINVWGWGGGTTLAELELARFQGAHSVMLSGQDNHLEAIRATTVTAIDHRQFGNLFIDAAKLKGDPAYAAAYRTAEKALVEEVKKLTSGRMVQIFCDYIGKPVYRATLASLGREGVITTAGWKEGMEITLLRAKECVMRHQHVHTHYARYPEGWKAVAFAEGSGWMPAVSGARIYSFDDVPLLAQAYEAGDASYFPIYTVNA